MHIVIFNWRDMKHEQAGGAEAYLHHQAVFWAKKGHRVDWVTSKVKGHPRYEVVDGLHVYRNGGIYTLYPCAVMRYLKLKRPDVVIDALNGVPFWTPLFVRVPRVLLIHHISTDIWLREFPKLVARFGIWLETWLMPRVYRKDPIITVSESSKKMIKQLFYENPVTVVHNAINSRFCPGEKASTPEIIYCGRLKKYKSIDVLLDAFSRLTNLNCTLHIVGRGDDEERLKRRARQLDLKNVIFHGFVSEDEKMRLLQRAWIAVNPSKMEGWGITNVEANVCGTPVVGADVPGIRDSIEDGESGVLVPYGDVNVLAGVLCKFLRDDAYRTFLSRGAVEWAKNFSWEVSSSKFMNVLKKKESGDV